MVDCLTDDRSRAAADVRRTFRQHGGYFGAADAVGYLFNTVGLLTYPPGTNGERLKEAALDAGAEDVVRHADSSVEVLTDPLDLAAVRTQLTQEGFAPATAEVTQRAAISLELSGETAEAMLLLLKALEQLDDVRDVYSNADIAPEVLARS